MSGPRGKAEASSLSAILPSIQYPSGWYLNCLKNSLQQSSPLRICLLASWQARMTSLQVGAAVLRTFLMPDPRLDSKTLYCLVKSVRRSLFSRMSGLGLKGERAYRRKEASWEVRPALKALSFT